MSSKMSRFMTINNKVRSELNEYKGKMSHTDYENLIGYVTLMCLGVGNITKEFLGFYGKGKTTLTSKICSMINFKSFKAICKCVDNQIYYGNDNMFNNHEFSDAKIIIFNDDYEKCSTGIKACTSGDYYSTDTTHGTKYKLDKYVIAEFNTEPNFDESTLNRQIKIQLF